MTEQRGATSVPRFLAVFVVVTALAVQANSAAARVPAGEAASKVVVRANFKSYSTATMTVTYSSSKGNYRATWIGIRRYRLRGTINGRRLRGTIRTRQAASRERYLARGSGRLGSRRVRIGGGGPNNLRTTTLVLRW
jgi:hypothetical protein